MGKLGTVREKQLEDLGVVWDILEQRWNDVYILLAQYVQREGHYHVPTGHKEDGEKLGK